MNAKTTDDEPVDIKIQRADKGACVRQRLWGYRRYGQIPGKRHYSLCNNRWRKDGYEIEIPYRNYSN